MQQRAMRKSRNRRGGAFALALLVAAAVPAASAQSVDERPNGFAMVGDLVVARPIGVVMTAAGAAAFIVSLPFTALAGHVSEAAETLVLGPGEATFMRCLGCREPGYSYKDKELREARDED
jgi:hypothetical protein